jgi:hypothetical protein
MAATLFGESVSSRSLSGGVIDLVYFFYGTDDDAEVLTAALSASPTTHNGLERKSNDISITPIFVESNEGWWEARVPYGVAEWGFNVGSDSYSFDTSGGIQHLTQSYELVAKYPTGAPLGTTGENNGGAPIGATADGVAGVDLPVGQFEWEETHIFSWGDIDDTYKDKLAELTGRTNDATFQNCAEGEALFLGARGGKLPDNTGAITFRFAKSKNVTGLVVGDITGIDKKGWEYLDVFYEPKDIGSFPDKITIMVPKYVYIHRVTFKGDFSDLGI